MQSAILLCEICPSVCPMQLNKWTYRHTFSTVWYGHQTFWATSPLQIPRGIRSVGVLITWGGGILGSPFYLGNGNLYFHCLLAWIIL